MVLKKMQTLKDSTQVIYSSIIKGFAQAKQPEKCFDVLDEMEEQGQPSKGGLSKKKKGTRGLGFG